MAELCRLQRDCHGVSASLELPRSLWLGRPDGDLLCPDLPQGTSSTSSWPPPPSSSACHPLCRPSKLQLAMVEIVITLAIIINTALGIRHEWHRRWLDYRQLAERLRPLRSLKLGIAAPIRGQPRQPWSPAAGSNGMRQASGERLLPATAGSTWKIPPN